MLEDFTSILKTGKIRLIECAAESGSNRILKLMNRKYTIEEYKNCINAIRRAYPGIMIRTQLIVGFPTETEEDFKKSLRLLDELVFHYVEVYQYSGYPDIPSERIQGKVQHKTLRQRYLRLYLKAMTNRVPMKIRHILSQK